ncbi:glycosyltransferase family 2 protein [Dasania marina]|uniref:glycosyltransferase family 2 protein n=1 Tax=Dasania marina TaxID=471499 RepID=UPI0030DDCF45|tara:strand:- start:99084 stop:100283 length:1200 start_codon:yes stop_codon:yes gene_type:complete
MLVTLFWLLTFCALYSYFIYPVILLCLARCKASPPQPDNHTSSTNTAPASTDPAEKAPTLSLIITAYNEVGRIRNKINNTLALKNNSHEQNKSPELEIIIASDCSDDGTDDIVKEYSDQGIKLVRAPERLGKEHAQLCAIKQAQGDVLIFSDVATQIPEDAIEKLSNYFCDPTIGSISSEDRFISQSGDVVGEGAYVRYEMWLRSLESKVGGLVGLSGSFFAARKDLCQTWDIHSPSDFNTALNTATQGMRAITAPDVLGYYQDLSDPSKEYARKTRTIIRGLTSLSRNPQALNPLKHGLFAFQVISHKLMRWLEPWFLIGLLFVNFMLASQHSFFALTLVLQCLFYGTALCAHYSSNIKNNTAAKLIYFFVQVNMAIFDASCQFLAGKRMSVWQPSAR